jgi:transposase
VPKQPFISIPLDIPDVRVLQTDLTQANEFILTVESTLESTTCRRCGRTITEQHGQDRPRLLRHLPILGRVVYLRIRPKRFRCPFCDDHPTTTQELDWYDPNALHTKAYERHLIVQLVNSTVTDVVAKEDVSYDALEGILDRSIAATIDWQALEPFTVLGIAQIALKKGHHDFVAVLSAKTTTGRLHVLAILPERLKATVAAWLETIPEEHRQRIQTVCTDMWEGYVTAVQEVLPTATIVIDRFQVARHYRDAVDQLRKQELRRLRATLSEEMQDDLKHILWPSRKCPADLDEEERAQLERFLAHSPALRQASTLREELTTIFDTARGRADGLRRTTSGDNG